MAHELRCWVTDTQTHRPTDRQTDRRTDTTTTITLAAHGRQKHTQFARCSPACLLNYGQQKYCVVKNYPTEVLDHYHYNAKDCIIIPSGHKV